MYHYAVGPTRFEAAVSTWTSPWSGISYFATEFAVMDKASAVETSRGRRSWLCLLLVPLLAVGALTLVVETSTLGVSTGLHRLTWLSRFNNVLPPGEAVPDEDLLHLNLLHEVCMMDTNASLPWQFGSPGNQLVGGIANNSQVLVHQKDKDLLQRLRQCADVDVFLPHNVRTNGYCEDAVAYVKYLKSRLLPEWILEVKLYDPKLGREVDYFDLCPKTPMLFLDHNWGGITKSPRWPRYKPVYMMPNIEIVEVTPVHYWRVDAVLCKTNECYDRVTRWYEQEGNPRNAKVFYTRHTSSDLALFARKRFGEYGVVPKDFSEIKFLHTAGTSSSKGTREVVECWTYTSGLPPLDVYIDRKPFYRLFPASYKMKVARSLSPINIHLGTMKRLNFSKLTADASFVINPSYSEGYGHIINQARASGALVLTTDMPPMNELIIANETGILISVKRQRHPMVMLGGKYKGAHGLTGVEGLVASFESYDVCSAVKWLVESTTPGERADMAFNARRQYHADTKYFASAMEELRKFAKK
ncbi:unnamed protein product [Phytophthora fragariaefolia]|uniref:Unnamed protein product n=1 Tax=Phytophthora fragariaefolia TaxID=1490495 RepID=A0A9W6Y427_9STRA|nr:unnamed protein product [Phytophthora fragariaefolia]